MVAVLGVKRLIGRQGHENGLQIVIERSPMLAPWLPACSRV